MPRNKNHEINRRLTQGLSGTKKLRTLLGLRSGSITGWAKERGYIPEQVFMCTSGKRPYPEIRDAIAADLELTRADVDVLIEGSRAAAAT